MAAASATLAPRLTGMAWWRSLGSPRFVASPMVDASELPFRLLCREYGAQLCYTPMLHSRLLLEQPTYLDEHFSTCAADAPLIAQVCGNDPAVVLAAARVLQGRGVAAVDLNLGCPQGIAKRGRYGAFLLDEPDTVLAIVRALAGGLDIPVTCKIRVLPSAAATVAFACALEAAGASLLTIHGRVRGNMKQAITSADWDVIAACKAALTIPVVANGSIACLADVRACLAATGADGVMASEALLENPGLFSQGIAGAGATAVTGGTPAAADVDDDGAQRSVSDVFALTRRYLDLCDETGYARMGIVKGHVFKSLFGVWRVFPELRTALAESARTMDDVRRLVDAAAVRYAAEWAPQLFNIGSGGGCKGVGSSTGDSLAPVATDAQARTSALPSISAALSYRADVAARIAEHGAMRRAHAATDPRLAWSAPAYLTDPAQPGAWYMRHRPGAYNDLLAPASAGGSNSAKRPRVAAAAAEEDDDAETPPAALPPALVA